MLPLCECQDFCAMRVYVSLLVYTLGVALCAHTVSFFGKGQRQSWPEAQLRYSIRDGQCPVLFALDERVQYHVCRAGVV